MARPVDSPVKRAIKAAIAKLIYESQPPGKVDSNVNATAEEIRKHVEQNPGWRGMPDSPRRIYTLLGDTLRKKRDPN